MKSKIGIVIRREYLERVSKKSFIFITIVMPLLMVALIIVPALIAILNTPEAKRIAVIDESGLIAPMLQSNNEISFVVTNNTFDKIKTDKDIDGILLIKKDILISPTDVAFYTSEASSITVEQNITMQIERIIEDLRLKNYNIDNLQQILADVKAKVSLNTYRLDKDEMVESSTTFSYAVGMVMTFILYMLLLFYGQLVMNSIIEEKNNRVLEIVVSSVKPSQLMLGKIIGIGLVAVTQVVIWAILLATILSGPGLSLFLPTETMGLINNMGLLPSLSILSNGSYVLEMFGFLLLFLIGGFLFYASIYAAIGAAVDNVQDAGQLQSIAVLPILLGIILSFSVVSDPNSTIAIIASMIPFTSPMVMMARIPFGIPIWEVAMSLIILYITFFLVVWLSAKIYRVGIFMYGKKPTVKDLIHWISYK